MNLTRLLFLSGFVTVYAISCDNSYTGSSFSSVDRQVFVDKHNDYRSELANGNSELPDGSYAPPASNMYKITYNCELEKMAQTWVDRCVFDHSVDNDVGENLYMLIGTGDYRDWAISEASDMWWFELQEYGGITNSNVTFTEELFNGRIGHWSQMAWGDTNTIGCGYAECPESDGWTMYYIVCNYRSSGNFLGSDIYEIGPPCAQDSDCTTKTNSHCEASSGLCYV